MKKIKINAPLRELISIITFRIRFEVIFLSFFEVLRFFCFIFCFFYLWKKLQPSPNFFFNQRIHLLTHSQTNTMQYNGKYYTNKNTIYNTKCYTNNKTIYNTKCYTNNKTIYNTKYNTKCNTEKTRQRNTMTGLLGALVHQSCKTSNTLLLSIQQCSCYLITMRSDEGGGGWWEGGDEGVVMRGWWWGGGDEGVVMRGWWWGGGDEGVVMRRWCWRDGEKEVVMRGWWGGSGDK